MNKITGGIHMEKYYSFAHKCRALAAVVHNKALSDSVNIPLLYLHCANTFVGRREHSGKYRW